MLDRPLLESILAAHGAALADDAFARLDRFAERLVETNRQFNLTAVTDPAGVTVKHFADSLVLFGLYDFPAGARVLDVGTGAGFPGLALKLYRPDLQLTFLDGTRKKLDFIAGVLADEGLAGETVHLRAEEAGRQAAFREAFDVVTARAVADMAKLAEFTLPFVRVGGAFLAMKSESAAEEVRRAQRALTLLGGRAARDTVYRLTPDVPRRLIVVRKISQTPTKYPRASAQIAKKPL